MILRWSRFLTLVTDAQWTWHMIHSLSFKDTIDQHQTLKNFLFNPDSVLRCVHTRCAFNSHWNLHWQNPDGMRIDHVHMRSSNRTKFILNFAWLLLSHVTYEVHAIDVLALDFRLNYVWLCWKHQSNRRRREINQRRRHQARMRCILLWRQHMHK